MALPSDSSEFSLSPFDEALIEAGYLSLSEIHQALIESRRTGVALPLLVESMLGESLPEELHRQYEGQQLFGLSVIHGVKFFDTNQLMALADTEAIATLLNRYFPLPICQQYGFLPLHYREDPGALLVVMVNPSDKEADQFLQRQLTPHKLTLRRRGVTQEDFDHLLDKLYSDPTLQEILNTQQTEIVEDDYDNKATVVEVTEIIEDLPQQISAMSDQPPPPRAAEPEVEVQETPAPNAPEPQAGEEGPEVKLANKILILGLRQGASEIHIDPQDNRVLVRIRQGGNMRMLLDPLPREFGPKLVNRLKTMTHLDTSQTKVPQKARIRKSYNGQSVYFYINILPSFYGEKILVRVVPSLEKLPDFEDLCGDRQGQETLQNLVNTATTGLVVLIGAAYGGKTSTMEAFLGQQLKQSRSVALVSDPLIHVYKEVNQLEVNQEKEFTGEKAVQSLQEQSFDVVAVDPLEDKETAQALTQALNQERLVFVSVIAKDIPSAIVQLQSWFEPSVLAQHLLAIVSQSLVRRVCPTCRLEINVTPEEQQQFNLPPGPIYRAKSLSVELMAQPMAKNRLCPQCQGLGYLGMTGIFEVLPMTPTIKQLVHRPCSRDEILSSLKDADIPSPARTAIALVGQGITTLEEVNRLFPQQFQKLSPLPQAPAKANVNKSQPSQPLTPNGEWWQRLQQLEKSLQELNQAVADLKRSAGSPPIPPRQVPEAQPIAPSSKLPPSLDLMAELQALEDLSAHKKLKPRDDEDANLLQDFIEIEELLIDEGNPPLPPLDPDEAPPMGEDQSSPPEEGNLKTFKSVADPW